MTTLPVSLFLLPPAGGSAAGFRGWRKAFPPGISAVPVELPGRGRLLARQPVTDLAALVTELDARYRPADGRWAVLGHSMGGLTAAAWAERASEAGRPAVVLYLSAVAPPWLNRAATILADLGDDDLWHELTTLGGIPRSVVSEPAARRLLLRLLRADIVAAASWQPAGPVRAGCPVVAVCGRDEHGFSRAQLAGWERASRSGFESRLLPGGHFYQRGLDDLMPLVRADLARRAGLAPSAGTTTSAKGSR
jgi:surfactin synthase thioesterase subunit